MATVRPPETASTSVSTTTSVASAGATSRLPGFYKHSVDERRRLLGLSAPEHAGPFDVDGGLSVPVADRMIENVVGVLGLPLGVALNFVVDGVAVIVPMAVEEPSIVAACSHIARLAAEGGGFTTSADPPLTVGQVQLLNVLDFDRAQAAIDGARAELIERGNLLCPGLKERGGGVVDVRCRFLPRLPAHDLHGDLDGGGPMLIVHVVLNCADAMGANAVNTVVEGLSDRLAELSGGTACLRILTNLADERCARATMRIPFSCLGEDGADVARGIVDAYRFAARDPWRACTHNKGIMNGVDAVAIATGNDWRALEAGAHAYAARSGRYTSLSRFFVDDERGCLTGTITLPMAVGVVGGATRVHPTVQAARKLLGSFASSTTKLAGLMAAVGLAQNTGALKAMVTEGIQRGHMALHARQVALAAGATAAEVEAVARVLVDDDNVRLARAQEVLATLRASYD
ncbi:MAG: hydroxymethylglutaryl-CoA reductase, degradative [Deltaproteobacteria bacterium]|nr:hydroxymethylglutaryl-CoA reductase, degradative [Deltaproteobacteria bacterium]